MFNHFLFFYFSSKGNQEEKFQSGKHIDQNFHIIILELLFTTFDALFGDAEFKPTSVKQAVYASISLMIHEWSNWVGYVNFLLNFFHQDFLSILSTRTFTALKHFTWILYFNFNDPILILLFETLKKFLLGLRQLSGVKYFKGFCWLKLLRHIFPCGVAVWCQTIPNYWELLYLCSPTATSDSYFLQHMELKSLIWFHVLQWSNFSSVS